jgi:5-methylcytosine-specific restriction endonuclease McrA
MSYTGKSRSRLKLIGATGEPKKDTNGLDYLKQLVVKGKYTKEFRKCWMCGKALMKTETSIHHIIPKFFEPVYNFVIPLCYPCHTKIHKNPNGLGSESELNLAKNIISLENKQN